MPVIRSLIIAIIVAGAFHIYRVNEYESSNLVESILLAPSIYPQEPVRYVAPKKKASPSPTPFEKCSGLIVESDGFGIVTKFTLFQSWDEIDEACSHFKK